MTSNRQIVWDAAYMIAYVGIAAAMVVLTATLWAHSALGVEMGTVHTSAAALNVAGWALLPFAPSLYSRITGQPFSWRSSGLPDAA